MQIWQWALFFPLLLHSSLQHQAINGSESNKQKMEGTATSYLDRLWRPSHPITQFDTNSTLRANFQMQKYNKVLMNNLEILFYWIHWYCFNPLRLRNTCLHKTLKGTPPYYFFSLFPQSLNGSLHQVTNGNFLFSASVHVINHKISIFCLHCEWIMIPRNM